MTPTNNPELVKRNLAICGLRQDGMILEAIGECYGITGSKVATILNDADRQKHHERLRERRWRAWKGKQNCLSVIVNTSNFEARGAAERAEIAWVLRNVADMLERFYSPTAFVDLYDSKENFAGGITWFWV